MNTIFEIQVIEEGMELRDEDLFQVLGGFGDEAQAGGLCCIINFARNCGCNSSKAGTGGGSYISPSDGC